MRKWTMKMVMVLLLLMQVGQANAQIAFLEVIKAGIKKVIKAIDLKIQREQNKVIWLQNAQKTVENTMSKLKLNEISDWVGKQKDLYQDYYQELTKVKSVISYYQRIRHVAEQQAEMLQQYRTAYDLFKKDTHFTPDEISHIGSVYTGMLDQSLKNIDLISTLIGSFTTTMTDGKRMELIDRAADQVEETVRDMHRFTTQNKILSLQRAQSETEIKTTKLLYGLQ